MTIRKCLVIAIGVVTLSASAALAQLMTEQYIPIGYSPGISGKYSAVGRISAIDRDARLLTVEDDGRRRIFKMRDETFIWLDRTRWKRTNLEGSYRDCKVGRRVEVMHRHDNESIAEWVKIEAKQRL